MNGSIASGTDVLGVQGSVAADSAATLHPCARCAQVQKTCCQLAEILVTDGDIARIEQHLAQHDLGQELGQHVGQEDGPKDGQEDGPFTEFREPVDPSYREFDPEDPNWVRLTVRADGTRRMLKRAGNGDCTFLGEHGCVLPTEVRPLICRLYPYAYDEAGLRGENSGYCPTNLLAPKGESMIDVLDIPRRDARRWHAQLYAELHLDHERRRTMASTDLLIGLTYDLRDDYRGLGLSEEELAEFDRVDTIERLEAALRELGHRTDRIGNVKALVGRLQSGDRWDLVFNIAEGRFGSGREAQVPALLDAYSIPYTFSDPLVCALTLHKAATKHVLRDQGVPTPKFALVAHMGDLAHVDLEYPLFAKPVAEGTSKGIDEKSVIRSAEELLARCEHLLERHRQPVLVEEYLPGRELTIGVLGTGANARTVGALEVHLLEGADAGVYTFRNKEDCETLVRYELAHDELAERSSALALHTWRVLGCRDGGRVDVRCDARGEPSVMEVNPLPGMHPEHSDLPILWGKGERVFTDLVGAIVASACERLGSERVVNTKPQVAAAATVSAPEPVALAEASAEAPQAQAKAQPKAKATSKAKAKAKAKPSTKAAKAKSPAKPIAKAPATSAAKAAAKPAAVAPKASAKKAGAKPSSAKKPLAKKSAVAKPVAAKSSTAKAKAAKSKAAKPAAAKTAAKAAVKAKAVAKPSKAKKPAQLASKGASKGAAKAKPLALTPAQRRANGKSAEAAAKSKPKAKVAANKRPAAKLAAAGKGGAKKRAR
jgi:D-alanine-D-alanine ligase